MKIEEFKSKYYDVDAKTFSIKDQNIHKIIEAIKHSLKKWKGIHDVLYAESAEKDTLDSFVEFEDEHFAVDSNSCSLCILYDVDCDKCPLNDCQNEYDQFIECNDPVPMIELLEEALSLYTNPESAGGGKS